MLYGQTTKYNNKLVYGCSCEFYLMMRHMRSLQDGYLQNTILVGIMVLYK